MVIVYIEFGEAIDEFLLYNGSLVASHNIIVEVSTPLHIPGSTKGLIVEVSTSLHIPRSTKGLIVEVAILLYVPEDERGIDIEISTTEIDIGVIRFSFVPYLSVGAEYIGENLQSTPLRALKLVYDKARYDFLVAGLASLIQLFFD